VHGRKNFLKAQKKTQPERSSGPFLCVSSVLHEFLPIIKRSFCAHAKRKEVRKGKHTGCVVRPGACFLKEGKTTRRPEKTGKTGKTRKKPEKTGLKSG